MGTAMPIEWHKQCLKNSQKHVETLQEQMWTLEDEIVRIARYTDFYDYQIREAESEGKITFDNERYKIKEKDQF